MEPDEHLSVDQLHRIVRRQKGKKKKQSIYSAEFSLKKFDTGISSRGLRI
jgi:hypothetical protein